jgi:ABC-type spermidine/putrescine transport system permease subunit I
MTAISIAPSSIAAERIPSGAWLALLPAVVAILLLLVIPLAATVYLSLSPNVLVQFDGPALDNFLYLFGKPYYLDVLWRTLRVSFFVTLACLLIGYPAAYALKEVSGQTGSALIIMLTFPILTGPLVVVLGWMILLSDGGPLFRPLIQAGLFGSLRLLGTETAVVIGLTNFTLPFVILTLYSSLKQIPHDLIEAARSLGASGPAVLRNVIWPLSLPGVLSASIIGFSLAASAYVSPHYLGGATRLTLTTLVAQFILATYNSEMAAAAAVVLLVIMAVIIFVFTRVVSRYIR